MNSTQALVLICITVLAGCNRPTTEFSSLGIPEFAGSRQAISLSSETAATLHYAALEAEHKPLPSAQKARSPEKAQQSGAKGVAGDDLQFIQRITNDSQAREQAALYVASKTKNKALRDYAALMGQELGKANAQLRRLAAKRSVETPADPMGLLRDKLDRLRQLTGAQMDQAFLQDFAVEGNRDAIALFEEHANQAADPELREFIIEQLPQLREHYKQGEALRGKRPTASAGVMWALENGTRLPAGMRAHGREITGI